MKKNGMTIIELVVAFALTSVIALFLVQVVVFLKDTYVVNAVRSEIVLKQSTVSNMINELLSDNSIKSINQNCGDNCVLVTFDDSTTQEINFDVEGNRIIVGDYVSKLPSTSKIDNVDVRKQFFLDENGETSYVFSINADVTSELFNDEIFKISAVYQSVFAGRDNEYADGMIVYYDVKKGIGCTVEEYESSYDSTIDDFQNSLTGYNGINGTGNQNSCLKFYAFNDKEGDTEVNLLLDHNTTDLVYWNSSGSNATGPKTPEESTTEILGKLKTDTESWNGTITPTDYTVNQTTGGNYTIDYSDYKARLISADEVAEITRKTSFDESTTSGSNYFYLDTNTTSPAPDCTSGDTSGCEYGWLYDRTSTYCTDYGCENNSDVFTYGYWTSTSTFGNSVSAWNVSTYGLLGGNSVRSFAIEVDEGYGVRPVIKVLKSKLINDNTGEDTNTTYEITYDCNGGSGSTAKSTHIYGVASNLSTNGCYKITSGTGTGTSASPNVYYLVGWSTSSTATTATYADGQSVTDVAESGTVTLYAVWDKLFTYSNKYQVIDDTNGNWRVKFLESGTCKTNSSANIDIFLVGGGEGGGCGSIPGGGGGYTTTQKNKPLATSKSYSIVIGAGGTGATTATLNTWSKSDGGNGGTSSAFGYTAAGGGSEKQGWGGNGGGGMHNNGVAGTGGAYGWPGENVDKDNQYSAAGDGQHTSTCEFAEGGAYSCNSDVDAYAGGGGGGAISTGSPGKGGEGGGGSYGGDGQANTGGGGGSTYYNGSTWVQPGDGGSGVVVIRNAR